MTKNKSMGSQGLMNRTGRVFSDPEQSKEKNGQTPEFKDMKRIIDRMFNEPRNIDLTSRRQWTQLAPSSKGQCDIQVYYGKRER